MNRKFKGMIVLLIFLAMLTGMAFSVESQGELNKENLLATWDKITSAPLKILVNGFVIFLLLYFLIAFVDSLTPGTKEIGGVSGVVYYLVAGFFSLIAAFFTYDKWIWDWVLDSEKLSIITWIIKNAEGDFTFKPFINIALIAALGVFGLKYLMKKTEMKPGKVVYFLAILIGVMIAFNIGEVTEKGEVYVLEKDQYVWDSGLGQKVRLAALGDPNCWVTNQTISDKELEEGKAPDKANRRYYCYHIEQFDADSEKEYSLKSGELSKPGKGMGVLRGFNLIMLIMGIFLVYWALGTKFSSSQTFNALVAFLLAFNIVNTGMAKSLIIKDCNHLCKPACNSKS